MKIRASSTWYDIDTVSVKVSGSWYTGEVYVRDNGSWHLASEGSTAASSWTYLGTTYVPVEASYNATATDKWGEPRENCAPTYTTMANYLPAASGFSIGDKVRIRHTYTQDLTPYYCDYYYFEAE
jgi:hypothetical protein